MARNKRKLKVIYKNNWGTATPEQKKELEKRLSSAYDLIFRKVLDREQHKNPSFVNLHKLAKALKVPTCQPLTF